MIHEVNLVGDEVMHTGVSFVIPLCLPTCALGGMHRMEVDLAGRIL